MLGMRSSHVGDYPIVPVRLTGRTDTGMGSGVCPELFAHLTDLVQPPITFKHCLGILTKNMPIPLAYPSPLPGGGLCDSALS